MRVARVGRAPLVAVVAALYAAVAPRTLPAQILETETARLLPRRAVEIGGAFEGQGGGGGIERAVPFIVMYGITNRIELAIEPVPYTLIKPSGEPSVHGPGDLEGTFTVRFRDETARMPALAFAAEVKVPTATNALIGTGRADYTGWAIASKRFGRVDTHANVAYTFTGSPPDIQLNDTWTGALAAEMAVGRAGLLFAETMATTAAAAESGDAAPATGDVIPPEAAGAEVLGTLGVGRYFTRSTLLFGSLTYDSTQATLLRIGMTIRLR